MKVLIAGAGIGGLALAGFLEGWGIEFELAEKHEDWLHEGYTLGMWNNGRAILEKLGVGDEFDRSCFAFQKFVVCDHAGKELRGYELTPFRTAFGMAYSHISRGDLHDWLLSRIDPRKLRMGVSVEKVSESAEGVTLTLSDGGTLAGDILVGADGVHSKVRDLHFAQHVEEYTGWRVWYFWTDKAFATTRAVTQYVGPGTFVSVFDNRDRALAVLVAKADHEIWDDEADRITRLARMFQGERIVTARMFEGVQARDILPTDLEEVRLGNLHTDRVVLIGDAAHGFEPSAGLGGSMALEDAYILAGELMQHPDDPRMAFRNYRARRTRRVEQARKLTRRMQGWANIENPLVRNMVNRCIPFIPESFLTKGYFSFLSELP